MLECTFLWWRRRLLGAATPRPSVRLLLGEWRYGSTLLCVRDSAYVMAREGELLGTWLLLLFDFLENLGWTLYVVKTVPVQWNGRLRICNYFNGISGWQFSQIWLLFESITITFCTVCSALSKTLNKFLRLTCIMALWDNCIFLYSCYIARFFCLFLSLWDVLLKISNFANTQWQKPQRHYLYFK